MKVTIDIVSGFLGAGKTTFIKHYVDMLLKEEKTAAEKTAILENEFGSIAFDSEELETLGLPVETVKAGCICCSGSGDLVRNFLFLIEKYNPDRIIIEPTGVAKLSDIKRIFSEAPLLEKCRIGRIITIADARHYSKRMLLSKVFFEDQIKASPVIVLSKTEAMEPRQKDALAEEIFRLNSGAAVLSCSYEALSVDMLDRGQQALAKPQRTVRRTVKKNSAGKTAANKNIFTVHERHTQNSQPQVRALSFQWVHSAEPDGMQHFLEDILNADSRQILRIKGTFSDSDHRSYTISYVQNAPLEIVYSGPKNNNSKLSAARIEKLSETDPAVSSEPVRITIIGTGLDANKIEAAAQKYAVCSHPLSK